MVSDIRGNVDQWTDELTYNEAWQILTSHRSPEGGHSPWQRHTPTTKKAGDQLPLHRRKRIEETTTYDENGNCSMLVTRGRTLNLRLSHHSTLKEAWNGRNAGRSVNGILTIRFCAKVQDRPAGPDCSLFF